MKAIKDFLLKMFSGENEVSSKRVAGIFCIFFFSFLLGITFFGIELNDSQVELMVTLFYGGAALLGVGILDRRLK